eukprot:Colp12_sorted_trinity150504_noHs@3724
MSRFLLFACLLALVCAASATWTSCASDADLFRIDTIDLPDTAAKGKNITVTVKGFVKETLNAPISITGTAGIKFLKVPFEIKDACTDPQTAPFVKCPIAAGDFVQTVTEAIPSVPFSGPVKIHLTVNANSKEVTCLDLTVNLA